MSKPWEKYKTPDVVEMPWEKHAVKAGGVTSVQKEDVQPEWADVKSNIAGSAIDYVKNLGAAVANPLETLSSLYHMVKGSGVPLPGGLSMIPRTQEDRAAFMGFANVMKDRYGSPQAMKKTMVEDPVGFLADASGLVSGAGALTKGIGMTPKVARVGQAIQRAGEIADPLNIARQTVTAPLRAIGGTSLPERMYMGVIKPGKQFSPEQRAQMMQTAAREKALPTARGAGLLGERIEPLAQQARQVVEDATTAGERISRKSVVERAIPVMEEAGKQVAPIRPTRQAAGVVSEFIESVPEQITPSRAQAIKQTTGKALHKQYGELKSSQVEANKAIVRGLKEELENLHPELKKLNEGQAELINLKRAIEDSVGRIENRNLLGLDTAALMGGAGIAGGPFAGASALIGKSILGHPQVKSRLAIALARARKVPNIGTGGAATRALLTNIERSEEYGR